MKSLYWFLIITFLMLAVLHFYWAVGGKWGFENALPHSEEGQRVLNPRPVESAIVGLGLLAFGVFYVLRSDFVSINLPGWLATGGSWLIPIIFLLRAIGDFKYVGFFKTITSTNFARLDTYIYSPLCMLVAITGFVLLWNHGK